jgi:hypothetical protein
VGVFETKIPLKKIGAKSAKSPPALRGNQERTVKTKR